LRAAAVIYLLGWWGGALPGQEATLQNGAQEQASAAALIPVAPETPPTPQPPVTDWAQARHDRAPRNITQGYYIIIKKDIHTLSLYKDGVLLKSYPVGTGKNPADKIKPQDNSTPEGHFSLKSVHDARAWLYTPAGGGASARNVYGPWFLRVDTAAAGSFSGKAWSGIGIHGTNQPASIGHDVSLGCIRMHNADIVELKTELDKAGDITQVHVDILP